MRGRAVHVHRATIDDRSDPLGPRTPSRPRGASLLIAVRVLWGTALLITPEALLRDLPHQRIDRPARMFARVLGARHLVQAVITGRGGTRGWVRVGAAVDATHAATMTGLAVLAPDRRKLALTNVATATGLAGAGLVVSRRA